MGGRNLQQRTPSSGGISPPQPHARPDEGSALPDLQSLLSGALTRLAEATSSTQAAAWAMRRDGEPYVAAAAFHDTPPDAPSPEVLAALEAIWQRGIPTDLGEPGLPATLCELVERHGFSSAAPLLGSDGTRLAMLLLGGPEDPAGRVRPRCLAALDSAVKQLRSPASAAAAFSRLSLLDDEICRLNRLAALGELLSEVIHEVRNPLVSIKTFLQLLPEHLHDREFHGDFRQVVMDELARMERLLNTVMDHARPRTAGGPATASEESCRVEEVLSSIARLLEQRAGEHEVSLVTELADELPPAAMDRDRLRQVLLNLTLNALEATPRGSSVTLRARGDGEGALELAVEDQGPGVSEERRSHVFEAFFTTRSDRAGGLGLAISKRLVDEVGGSIEIDEAPGGGARFRVRLPAAP